MVQFSIFLVMFCVISIVFSAMYVKSNEIFLKHRQRQTAVQEFEVPSRSSQLNIARYRKAVSYVLWLQLTLVVCYLPNGVSIIVSSASARLYPSPGIVSKFTFTLVFLNSSLNPRLYCWKMREVRQAVKSIIKQLWCCSA